MTESLASSWCLTSPCGFPHLCKVPPLNSLWRRLVRVPSASCLLPKRCSRPWCFHGDPWQLLDPMSCSLALSCRPKPIPSHWSDILFCRCTHFGWTLNGQTNELCSKCRLETKIFQDVGPICRKISKGSPLQVKSWGYLICVLWSVYVPYLRTSLLWNVPVQDQESGVLGSSTVSPTNY